jgi:hypothetical protein
MCQWLLTIPDLTGIHHLLVIRIITVRLLLIAMVMTLYIATAVIAADITTSGLDLP